ncbi:MAG: AbrB/MazE/SpoVT family DNA-binding domain-containing protein [Mycobacterium sp.]
MEVSRRVNAKRRVGLPLDLARWSGIKAKEWVDVGLADDRRWALVLIPVAAPEDQASAGRRDPVRPRQVTEVMQVTLPKPLMEKIGLQPDDWVFLSSLGQGLGMRVVPQAKVRLREVSAPASGPTSSRRIVAGGSSWSA